MRFLQHKLRKNLNHQYQFCLLYLAEAFLFLDTPYCAIAKSPTRDKQRAY